jgi:dUTP pyrophosphatase
VKGAVERLTLCHALAVPQILVKMLRPGAAPPSKARPEDAALDLSTDEIAYLVPGQRLVVGCGFSMALPPGHFAFTLPRSGQAASEGLTLLNSPGLIDPSYRGEVKVILHNAGDIAVRLPAGARVAQMLVLCAGEPVVELVEDLPASADGRGEAGFGSSGT